MMARSTSVRSPGADTSLRRLPSALGVASLLARLVIVVVGCLLLTTTTLDFTLAECGGATESSAEKTSWSESAQQRAARRVPLIRHTSNGVFFGARAHVSAVGVLLRRPSRTDVPASLGRSGRQRVVRLRHLLI